MKKIEKIDQELHEKFSECGKNAREWMRKCVMMLPEIERRLVWEKKGFSSIYEYAAKLAGMSRETVDDGLRILKKAEGKPNLMAVIEKRGINAVRPVMGIATTETEKFWADKAKSMSKNTLEMYVREFRKEFGDGDENRKLGKRRTSTPEEKGELLAEGEQESAVEKFPKKVIVMELGGMVLEKLEKLKGQKSWDELMEQLLKEREENLEARKPVAVRAKMVRSAEENKDGSEGRRYSRHIPMAVRRHVLAKTNGQCAFPRCVKKAKILHHTERFAVKKWHDVEKIRPMCVAHERIAHLSLIENEESESERWKVRKEVESNSLGFVVDTEVAEYRRR